MVLCPLFPNSNGAWESTNPRFECEGYTNLELKQISGFSHILWHISMALGHLSTVPPPLLRHNVSIPYEFLIKKARWMYQGFAQEHDPREGWLQMARDSAAGGPGGARTR